MNSFEKKLKNAAEEQYSLSHDERTRMKEDVRSYMKMRPIRRNEDIHYAFSSFFVAMRRTGAVVAVFAIVFVMGGLSAAANSALPGDVLYPIKHILEDARSTLSFSDESKAEWEVRRLERRIDEAALLEGMGELDREKRDRIEEAIGEHVERADELVAKVEENDGVVALSLRTDLSIELESRGEEVADADGSASLFSTESAENIMLAPQMSKVADDSVEEAGDVEGGRDYKGAASRQRKSARELISRVERQYSLVRLGRDVSDFEINILTPLASLRADTEKAEKLYKEGAYEKAHDLFVTIHKEARSLDLSLKRGSWRIDDVESPTPQPEVHEPQAEGGIGVQIDTPGDIDVLE